MAVVGAAEGVTVECTKVDTCLQVVAAVEAGEGEKGEAEVERVAAARAVEAAVRVAVNVN